jgi:membrane-associated phospholipid phosphatase
MSKILAVLVYPLGIAVLAVVAILLAGRAPRQAPAAAVRSPARPGLHEARGGGRGQPLGDAGAGAGKFLLVLLGGTVAVCFVTVLLGLLVVHAGPAIDKPFYHWTITHRIHLWTGVMKRATKVGDVWTTWGAAGAAAVCLAVTWRSKRWLPPVALGSLIIVDKFAVTGIHHFIHRVGPPASPLGTFPSGGASRAVVFYGLIAYLLWREFSGSRRAAIWSAAAVAALAFDEGYSRVYLTLHWLTDVLSGWVFGCLLLAVCIAAVRLVAGPARAPAPAGGHARAVVHSHAAAPEAPHDR